jgi:hypothetical protein
VALALSPFVAAALPVLLWLAELLALGRQA